MHTCMTFSWKAARGAPDMCRYLRVHRGPPYGLTQTRMRSRLSPCFFRASMRHAPVSAPSVSIRCALGNGVLQHASRISDWGSPLHAFQPCPFGANVTVFTAHLSRLRQTSCFGKDSEHSSLSKKWLFMSCDAVIA